MTGEACRGMVPAKCYAVHSGEFAGTIPLQASPVIYPPKFADSPRQGRL